MKYCDTKTGKQVLIKNFQRVIKSEEKLVE